MNQEQIEKSLADLDLSDVAFKLSQMALKLISGKEIEEKTYSVPLSIPTELADVFELLSEKIGVEVEEILGHLARKGFNTSLQHQIRQQQKSSVSPQTTGTNQPVSIDQFQQMAESAGLNVAGLQEKMSEFTNVVSKLQNIQRIVENVDITTSKENSSKFAVSPHTIPCPGSRKK